MRFFNFDVTVIFSFKVSPLGLMPCDTLMSQLLFSASSLVLRHGVGSLRIRNFLFVVILRHAARRRTIGSTTSATDRMVLIDTLAFWSYMLDFLSFQFPVIQHVTAAPRLCRVGNGKLLCKDMRREFITDEDWEEKIRQEGIEN